MANKLSRHFIKTRVLVVVEFHLSSQIFGSYRYTWVRLSIFIQEGGSLDGNLLHLATPVTMRQAARERASLS